ncbi:MAG: hypothetical protein ACOYYS_00100 [Chloroflexota bacterium]
MFRKNSKTVLSLFVCCVALCVNACSPSGNPLKITAVSISPEPLVGRISTLHIEVSSAEDQPEVWFTVNFLLKELNNRVYPVSGTTNWRGSLAANQPRAFDVDICVWEEGSWPIAISVDRTAEGDKYYVFETIQIESTAMTGKLIRARDFQLPPRAGEEIPTLASALSPPRCSNDSTPK